MSSELGAIHTIYAAGFYNSTPFSDLSVPRNISSITEVSWIWNTIPNGNTATEVLLCYRQPYATVDKVCADISADQIGTTSIFDTEDARVKGSSKSKGVKYHIDALVISRYIPPYA